MANILPRLLKYCSFIVLFRYNIGGICREVMTHVFSRLITTYIHAKTGPYDRRADIIV